VATSNGVCEIAMDGCDIPREIIEPFLRIARGIPDNWRGDCKIRFDSRLKWDYLLKKMSNDYFICLGTHPPHYEGGISCDEWRALLKHFGEK
jgi:hypothetical protein